MEQQGLTGEQFAQGLGTGFLSIWQGIGAQFNSTANYNNAVAQYMGTDAALAGEKLAQQERNSRRNALLIIVIFVLAALIPIGAILLTKKPS